MAENNRTIASQKVVKRLFPASYLRKVAAKLQLGCYLNVIIQPSYEGWIIIEQIEKLSPEAQIVVTTMYNPFLLYHPLYDLADGYINQINAEIKDNSYNYGYKVADVYSLIKDYDDIYGYNFGYYHVGYTPEGYVFTIHQDLPDVVHPTPFGYQMISNLIYSELK